MAKRGLPVVVKQVAAWHLHKVIGDALGDVVWLDQQAKRITGEVVAQTACGVARVDVELLLKDAKLATWRDCGAVNLLTGNLRLRIESSQRLDLVAEKLEANRPWAG